MNEERNEKFKRLANIRVNRILNSLRLLGNLSNKSHYKYSDEEIRRILYAIDEQLRIAKIRFKKRRRKFEL